MAKQPTTAVGAIVLYKGKLLLVLRKNEPLAGTWTLPGGRLKLGESLAEAIKREVLEETGLKIKVTETAGVAERIIRNDEGGVSFHYVIVDFFADLIGSSEAIAGDDAAEVRWVQFDELEALKLSPILLEFLEEHEVRKRAARQ